MVPTARELRKKLTDAEQELWRHIRYRQLLGCKFRRQSPIGKYVVDFVSLERQLIVELDGGQHAEDQVYDESRSEWLRSQGFKVIRFWNHDVLRNIEGVKEVIARNLKYPPPPILTFPHKGGREESGFPPRGGKGL